MVQLKKGITNKSSQNCSPYLIFTYKNMLNQSKPFDRNALYKPITIYSNITSITFKLKQTWQIKVQLRRNKHICTNIHIRISWHKDQRRNGFSNQQNVQQDSSFVESLVLFLAVFTECITHINVLLTAESGFQSEILNICFFLPTRGVNQPNGHPSYAF